MGTPLYDVNYLMVKNNNAILAFKKADVPVVQRLPASAVAVASEPAHWA